MPRRELFSEILILIKEKSRTCGIFLLLLFFINSVRAGDRIELVELEFLISKLLLILARVVCMTLSDAVLVAY